MKIVLTSILISLVALPVSAQVATLAATADSTSASGQQQGRAVLDSDSSEASGSVDMFIKIEDIDDESGDEGDPDQPIVTGNVTGEGDAEDPTLDVVVQPTDIKGTETEDIGVIDSNIDTGVEAASGFMKIGDIKGESGDSAQGADIFGDSDSDGDGLTDEAGLRDDADTAQAMNKADLIESLSSSSGTAAKKPKEIVVVGSKVRDLDEDALATLGSDVIDPTDVRSEDDLRQFVVQSVLLDENIVDTKVLPEEVVLSYEQPIRLFGFIPMAITQTTSVNVSDPEAEGRIKVQMPWWHVFAKKLVPAEDVIAALEEELGQIDPPSLELDAGPEDTTPADHVPTEDFAFNYEKVQLQSQTLQTMSNVSKMLHDTAMAIIRKIG